jgi:hypothetical protein
MASNGSTIDLAEICCLIDEAAAWNGGWLNGSAYTRWRAAQRNKGHLVRSRQHLGASGVNLVRTIQGMSIPTCPPKIPEDVLLAFVILAEQEVGVEGLSFTAYRRWQAERPAAPTIKTLVKRFGSWQEIADRAGVQVVSRNRTYSDADLVEVLNTAAVYLGGTGDGLSINAYEEWRKEHGGPTAPTIFNRCGSWSKARRAFSMLA